MVGRGLDAFATNPLTLGLEMQVRPRHFSALREISRFVLPLYLCRFGACRPSKCTGWYGNLPAHLNLDPKVGTAMIVPARPFTDHYPF